MKIHQVSHYATGLFLVVGLLSCSMSVAAEAVLNFGVYSSDKPTTMIKKFRPVLDAIESSVEKSLGMPVTIRMQVAKTYEQGVVDLVSGKVDFARFGPASYIQAKLMEPNIGIIAMESKQGKKVFQGFICISKDSKIRKISDLNGKRFAFGNVRSTIGRYLSQLYLVEHGIRASNLKYYEYLGRHDKVGNAVAVGKFDAGALKEGTFHKLVKSGKRLKILAHFPNVTKPWVTRSGLSKSYQHVIRKALLEMDDEVAFKTFKKDGFVPGDDSDFTRIREAITRSKEFFKPTTLTTQSDQ